MELLREKVVQKVITSVVNPEITTEVNNDGELGVSFYTIYLGFTNILNNELFKKELSFILRESEIENVIKKQKLKLEDVFAKYINEKEKENDMAKEDALKISEAYRQLIRSELQFIK